MKTILQLIIIIGLAFLYSPTLSAQAHKHAEECGTVLTQKQVDYMNKTRKLRQKLDLDYYRNQKNMRYYIPIQAHIIREDDGTNGLAVSDLEDELEIVNDRYAPNNMVFYLCGPINYIDDSDLVTWNKGYSAENAAIAENSVANVINVYFADNVLGSCGYATFPGDSDSLVVMDNDCTTNTSTFAHELGHFFNLYHTHQGRSTSLGVWGKELADGSNCGANIGDELCDTPADPVLSGLVSTECAYLGTATDSLGTLYEPDASNIMSYSQKWCRTTFTEEQLDRILTSYLIDRSYLSADGCCPESYTLTDKHDNAVDSADVKYEVSDNITASNSIAYGADITFDAGSYVLFSEGFVAESGSILSAYIDGCGGTRMTNPIELVEKPEITSNFPNQKAGEQGIAAPQNIRNYPNPFTGSTTIEYTLSEAAPVNLEVYDMMGRQVAVLLQNTHQNSGTHQIRFDAHSLPASVYYYTIRVGHHTSTHKMLLTE